MELKCSESHVKAMVGPVVRVPRNTAQSLPWQETLFSADAERVTVHGRAKTDRAEKPVPNAEAVCMCLGGPFKRGGRAET